MKTTAATALLVAALGAFALQAQPPAANPPPVTRNLQPPPPSRLPRLPAGYTVARNLEYGRAGAKILHLDIYYPEKSEKPVPLIVWIHGGAWRSGAKDGDVIPMLPLADGGFAIASVEYRLSQEAVFPAQIFDCKAAARWLRANAAKYNLDPAKFVAGGASAGGHLAALMGASGGVVALEGDVNDLKESTPIQTVGKGLRGCPEGFPASMVQDFLV
jgi:acetyl esterase/lipase